MNNFEKYKEVFIENYLAAGLKFAVTKNGKITPCDDIACEECAFYNDKCGCGPSRLDWLKSEYVDPTTSAAEQLEKEFDNFCKGYCKTGANACKYVNCKNRCITRFILDNYDLTKKGGAE